MINLAQSLSLCVGDEKKKIIAEGTTLVLSRLRACVSSLIFEGEKSSSIGNSCRIESIDEGAYTYRFDDKLYLNTRQIIENAIQESICSEYIYI